MIKRKTIYQTLSLLMLLIGSINNVLAIDVYCINDQSTSLMNHIQYLRTKTDSLDAKQVLANLGSAKTLTRDYINFGLTDHHFWFVVSVRNCTSVRQNQVLVLNIQRAALLSVYQYSNGALQQAFDSEVPGSMANNLLTNRTLSLPFSFEPDQTSLLLIHYNGTNNVALPLQLKSLEQHQTDLLKRQEVLSVLLSCIFTLIIFNAVLFLVTHLSILLYYSLMQGLSLLYFWQILGGTTVYFWGESYWDKAASSIIPVAVVTLYALFSREFFATRNKTPGLDKFLSLLIVVGTAWFGLKLMTEYIDFIPPDVLSLFAYVFVYVGLLTASVVAAYFTFRERKLSSVGVSNALILLALLVFTVNSLIMTMRLGGFINYSHNTEIIYGLLLLADVALIALALVLRIRHIYFDRQNKLIEVNQLQAETIEQQKETNKLIEQKVIADQAATQAGRLVLSVGHDARQMLGTIANYTKVLNSSKDPEQKTIASTAIEKSIDTLDDIVSNALVLSDDQLNLKSKVEYFSLSRLWDPLRLIYHYPASQKNLRLTFRYQDIFLYSDRIVILRILSNLINNAIENTSSGGILVTARNRGEQIVLQVWDTGDGMSDKLIQSIFSDESKLEQNNLLENSLHKNRNLGIGLQASIYNARKIGANINIKSRLNQGTLMEVVLPVKKTA